MLQYFFIILRICLSNTGSVLLKSYFAYLHVHKFQLSLNRPGEKPAETWAALRKQLREYTLNTQKDLEEERAKLMSENIVLKEQLKESQDYIDHHLVR